MRNSAQKRSGLRLIHEPGQRLQLVSKTGEAERLGASRSAELRAEG